LVRVRGFTLLETGAVTALPFAAGFIGILVFSYISDRSGRRKTVLVSALLGSAFFLALTALATSATAAIVFLIATGFFLPAIQGPFWSGGQLAGIASPIIIGALIQLTNDFHAGFIFMAVSACVSAVLVVTLRAPNILIAPPIVE
jgi:MFS family permease